MIASAGIRAISRPPCSAKNVRCVKTAAASQDRVLYWGSGSYPCWRAMITLEEKGLQYESRLLEFSKREHKSPEIMALNPRGQLPTFKEGDIVICESAAICMYLESQYPQNPLIPSEPERKTKALQRMFEALVTDPRLLYYTYKKVSNYSFCGSEKLSLIKRKGIENPLEEMELDYCKAEFSLWDKYLGNHEYAALDEFTMADVFLAPQMLVMERFGMTFKDYPNLKRYVQMIKERPSVANNSPPHWKESPPAYNFMSSL